MRVTAFWTAAVVAVLLTLVAPPATAAPERLLRVTGGSPSFEGLRAGQTVGWDVELANVTDDPVGVTLRVAVPDPTPLVDPARGLQVRVRWCDPSCATVLTGPVTVTGDGRIGVVPAYGATRLRFEVTVPAAAGAAEQGRSQQVTWRVLGEPVGRGTAVEGEEQSADPGAGLAGTGADLRWLGLGGLLVGGGCSLLLVGRRRGKKTVGRVVAER